MSVGAILDDGVDSNLDARGGGVRRRGTTTETAGEAEMRTVNVVLRVEIQDGEYIQWDDVEAVLREKFPSARWEMEPPGMKAVSEIMLPRIAGASSGGE